MQEETKPKLLVAPCDYKAAKYAVEHWHYSKQMPSAKNVCFGVWQDSNFIGVVIFGRGATPRIGMPYKLEQDEVCELTRIALTKHAPPVSQIAALAIKQFRKQSTGIRLIISYADPSEGHHGGIYQAMNWVYVGEIEFEREVLVNGIQYHRRSAHSKFGSYAIDYLKQNFDSNAQYVGGVAKHKYLYPLDKAMRKQIEPLAKPYPKR